MSRRLQRSISIYNCTQCAKVVKLSLFLLFAAVVSTHASVLCPQETEVTSELKNATIKESYDKTEKNSGYKFLFAGDTKQIDENKTTSVMGMRQNQTQKVTGRVTDKAGSPLPGVTIIVKDTKTGAATDIDGYFSFTNLKAEDKPVLQFSFIGFSPKEVDADFSNPMFIILEEEHQTIDEVVITGYQVLDKREAASSVFSVKTEDVMIDNAISVDQMLQGKIPGVSVLSSSGEPSSTPKIRIRGNATINGNKAPVWVVDGVIVESAVPFTASDLNSEDAEYLIGNAISGINPQDIESITVLKDASATAIYGVKAANGVIVITTKKGYTGKPVISYSGSISFNQRPSYRNFDRMSAGERMLLSREIAELGFRYPRIPSGDSYEGVLQELYRKKLTQEEFADKISFIQQRNTDWYKEIFRNSMDNIHNVNLTGGGQKANYYFSVGFNDNLGAVKGSEAKRLTTLAKINLAVNKYVDVVGKIGYSMNNNMGYHPSINPNMYAYKTSRTLAPYNEDGTFAMYDRGSGYMYNFIKEQSLTGQSGKTNNFDGLFNLNIRLMDGLSYQGVFSYHNTQSNRRTWAEEESYSVALVRGYDYHQFDETSQKYKDSRLPFGGILSQNNMSQSAYTIRNILTYKQTFRVKHAVHAMGGSELRANSYEGVSTTGYGWTPEFGEKFMPVYTDNFINSYLRRGFLNPNNTNRITKVASYFGTFSYSYGYKYTLNANVRSDGSNKFGSNPRYRWLPTWSVAAKWSVAEENFMKNITWLDMLDFRASYGIQGNIHDDATPELIVQIMERDGISQLESSRIFRLPNPDLRWEKTNSVNIATDFAILNNRAKGSFEIYNKYTTDLIHNKSVPASNGRAYLSINSGEMTNRGFEGFLNVDILRGKKFDWSVGFNFARNFNKVERANNDIYSEKEKVDLMLLGEMAIEGESLGSLYAYKFAGLSPENGYPLFYAKNGKKVHVADAEQLELVNCGSIFPSLYGGFDTQFTLNKNISLNIAFTYSVGGKKRLFNAYEDVNAVFDPLTNVSRDMMNRWKKPGDEKITSIPAIYDRDLISGFVQDENVSAISQGSLNYLYPTQIYNNSDERVVSSDFLRLRSVGISYLVPKNIREKLYLNTCVLRLQATNLGVWGNKKWKGLDPESSSSSIPILPSYTLTVNLSF